MRRPTRWVTAFAVSLGAAAMAVATVFACTSLATLNLSQASGMSGSQVVVTGSSFPSSIPTTVTIHWNGVDGPVLAQGIHPDATGAIGPVTVTIPSDLAPGAYVIVATQPGVDSPSAAFGTPARAAFTVTGTTAGSAGGAAVPTASAVSPSSGPGAGVVGLLVALGIAGMLLFGVGAATFAGSFRRVPSASRVTRKS